MEKKKREKLLRMSAAPVSPLTACCEREEGRRRERE
jgi:hypothetical protein